MLKRGSIVALTAVLFGCGAPATTTTSATGADVADASQTETTANPTSTADAEIVENREVEVTLNATLVHKYAQTDLPKELVDALVEAQIEFNIPEQFEGVPAEENIIWDYQYALKSKNSDVEVRFQVIPESKVAPSSPNEDAELPLSRKLSNKLMALLMGLNGANLVADLQIHEEVEARTRFNGQCYSTATFVPTKEVSDYEIGFAGIFATEGKGQVVVVSFFNDLNDPQVRTDRVTGANAMRFADETTE